MHTISKRINHDLELQIAFSAIAKDFPFSHYNIYKSTPKNKTENTITAFAEISEINNKNCVLKVRKTDS
jgi:hypothetical protein